jgi:hypothetical protein
MYRKKEKGTSDIDLDLLGKESVQVLCRGILEEIDQVLP